MQINQANIAALFRGLNVIFMREYQASPPEGEQIGITMRVTSTNAEEDYSWLASIPGLKEFIDEAQIENLGAHNFRIANKEWEDTISLKRKDIERDRIGFYNNLVPAMAAVAAEQPDDLLADVLFEGFNATGICYTGSPFFDTNHKPQAGGAEFSNVITNKLSAAGWELARANLRTRKNSAGRTMKLGKDLRLIVGPKNEGVAKKILEAEKVDGGDSNVNKGTGKVEVFTEIDVHNEDAWFVVEAGRPLKALIYQVELEPTPASLTHINDSHIIKFQEFLWQIYARHNVGYGLPELIFGSDGSAAAL